MLTTRGWWFLVGCFALVAFVAMARETSLLLLALAFLLWFGFEAFLFVIRSRLLVRAMTVEREVGDDKGKVESLWAGRTYSVRVRLGNVPWPGLAYARITDPLPFGVDRVDGSGTVSGSVQPEASPALAYRFRTMHPGRVRFEGLRLEIADLQGFFHHVEFLSEPLIYRVLPPLVDAEGHAPALKRHNILPSPGLHRFRRPGSGSELLDLRDYIPGDPPKTIAWKVSARRDRLITKEFESEVPLRCTFFLDASQAARVGPPGANPLARLVEITASIAQAAAATRDLTGLCVFDEEGVTNLVKPQRGKRHLIGLLGTLADVAGLSPSTGAAKIQELIPLARAFVAEVYPELLRPSINGVAFWMPWLWPQPAPASKRRSVWRLRIPIWPGGIVPARRRRMLWRKQMAAILSVWYNLGPGGLAFLMEDDDALSTRLQQFLGEHQVPYPVPLYDRRGRYSFASANKALVLAGALVRAVAVGRDNELFVLLADLLELSEQLEPLLRAARVALARHHQVVVVCPWPVGLPPPGSHLASGDSLADMLRDVTQRRFHLAFHELRHAFGRMGIPVISARSEDPVQLILERLDRLRLAGKRR